jgi:hypothetical protein
VWSRSSSGPVRKSTGGFRGEDRRLVGDLLDHGMVTRAPEWIRLASAWGSMNAERGETQRGEVALKTANVVLAHAEIMQKILGAGAMAVIDSGQLVGEGLLETDRPVSQGRELALQPFQLSGGYGGGHRSCRRLLARIWDGVPNSIA